MPCFIVILYSYWSPTELALVCRCVYSMCVRACAQLPSLLLMSLFKGPVHNCVCVFCFCLRWVRNIWQFLLNFFGTNFPFLWNVSSTAAQHGNTKKGVTFVNPPLILAKLDWANIVCIYTVSELWGWSLNGQYEQEERVKTTSLYILASDHMIISYLLCSKCLISQSTVETILSASTLIFSRS